ncbi:glycosyltransferase family 2 protein [Mucilaginibacter terrae]|uniref:glycosyltransferase family 2 protein n=1 Tax=Mucilaginibacter terrae TaxID=1955052 RepID=UPI00363B7A28
MFPINNSKDDIRPKVSIIIVTYNAGVYLSECLLSILQQKFTEYEIIIKDGGSTDDTLAIIKNNEHYLAWFESKPDSGIYDAMNQAIKMAKGKWIYFLGADDRLLDGFSEMCEHLHHDNTLYYGNCISDSSILGGIYSAYRIAKYAICHQAIFYPARVFEKYSYNTKYRVYADYALNLQCWGDNSIKKEYLNIDIAWYNLTGFSAVAADELFKQDKPKLIKDSMGWLMYLRFLYKRGKEQSRPGSNFY